MMILSKLIVKWLEWIVEIGLWLLLIACLITGIKMGDGFFGSIVGGLLSVLVGGVFGALVFGFFIVLSDIRRILKVAVEKDDAEVAKSEV